MVYSSLAFSLAHWQLFVGLLNLGEVVVYFRLVEVVLNFSSGLAAAVRGFEKLSHMLLYVFSGGSTLLSDNNFPVSLVVSWLKV